MNLHGLPSVEHLLQTELAAELIANYGRPLTLKAIRNVLDEIRSHANTNESLTLPNRQHILSDAAALLEGESRLRFSLRTELPLAQASALAEAAHVQSHAAARGRAFLSTYFF